METYLMHWPTELKTPKLSMLLDIIIYWSFVENTSVKQSMKCKVCSNFQMSFLHLSQMYPQ